MKTFNRILIVVLAMGFLNACNDDDDCLTGSGTYVSHEYTVSNFDALSINGLADVYITNSDVASLVIEGQENILEELAVEVHDGTLIIGEDNCFKDIKTLKIYVSTPTLVGVYSAGDCNVYSNDIFTSNVFIAEISGVGSMDLNLDVQEFNSTISGDASMMVKGYAQDQNYSISGIGEYNCFDLIGEQADISISGDGKLEVNVSEKLNVSISGVGNVYYKGNPSIKKDISGSGAITDAN